MTRQDFDTVDVLRLEVEIPSEGLPNLIQNPSGELGAWFWGTPVANTTMASNGSTLTFTTTTSQACHFITDRMPVAATKFVSARLDLTAITASHNIKLRFEWYDAAGALLSSSTQSAALSALGTVYAPTAQAPANTTHVRLRADFHNGAGNPSAAAAVSFKLAMATWQDTGTVSTVRTNKIKNPSAETNSTHWAGSGATLTRSTALAQVGSASFALTATAATGHTMSGVYQDTAGTTGSLAVVPGKTYAVQASVRSAAVGARVATISMGWRTAAGVGLKPSVSFDVLTSTSVWKPVTLTATAPSNAATVDFRVIFQTQGGGDFPAGEVQHFDAVMVEQSATLGSYFDGSTTDTASVDYAWTGTAHASTSTASTIGNTFDYTDPTTWQNILGPTHDISVVREDLNVGILSATILDAVLDPAVGTTLRPGRKVRLSALTDPGGVWEPIFNGKTTVLNVAYDVKTMDELPDPNKHARITLTAVDAVQTLANTQRPEGVATLAALPYVLEGAGVPWNVNGNGNQVGSATVVSVNESATALDQIAITRDTVHGLAWVDRYGVAQIWDPTLLPTTPELVDEAVYSWLDLGFSTTECINEVLVTGLTHSATTGETTEVRYGPYRDVASITEWGTRSATFVVHGLSAAQIDTFGAAVLAANATPTIKAEAMVIPIRETTDIVAGKALLDLYDLVNVVNTDKAFDTDLRVTRVSHQITPDKWLVGLGFASTGSVAAPQITPPVQSGGVVTEAQGTASTGTFSAVNTNKSIAVSFGVTFPSPPRVMATNAVADVIQIPYPPGVTAVTTTGFTLTTARAVGTGSFSVAWHAVLI